MEKDLLNSLLTLGLTQKEAQAYYSLVTKGVMTAEDISRSIDVQHPIVYRTLQGLENKGWIDSTSDRPKKYRAKSPKTASNEAGKRQMSAIEESAELIDSLLTPRYDECQEMLSQEIWTVRGYSSVLQKIRDMGGKSTNVFGRITGPMDDVTFNEMFNNIPLAASLKVEIMGPPIIDLEPELEKRLHVERPYFEGNCRVLPKEFTTSEEKQEFLKNVHSSRLISIHLLFDDKQVLWINIPYRNNMIVREKVWANWIIDPDYISIIKNEV